MKATTLHEPKRILRRLVRLQRRIRCDIRLKIDIVLARNFKVKTGSAEYPNSARDDSAMSHYTEVAFWRKTENRTLEVIDSTAKGTGNFFHDEWLRAKDGKSVNRAPASAPRPMTEATI